MLSPKFLIRTVKRDFWPTGPVTSANDTRHKPEVFDSSRYSRKASQLINWKYISIYDVFNLDQSYFSDTFARRNDD